MNNMIKGLASWAFLTTPNTKWEEDRYEITIEVDANTYQTFTNEVDFGTSFKDGKYFIKFHCPAKKQDGSPAAPPIFVDAQAAPTNVILGNGSEVYVKYRKFTYTRGRSQGKTRTYLEGVQIINLVPYTPDGDGDSGAAPTSVGFAPIAPASPHG